MLLWLDMETTGLEIGDDQVLEVGAILTRDDLREVGRFHVVCKVAVDRHMADIVRKMHGANGLLAAAQMSDVTQEQAYWMLHDWLKERLEAVDPEHGDDLEVTLAGSGVAHFDLPYLKAMWPEVADRLTYWVLDVGIMRRGNALCGVPMPEVPESFVTGAKAHRAMADVEAHLLEMRLLKAAHDG